MAGPGRGSGIGFPVSGALQWGALLLGLALLAAPATAGQAVPVELLDAVNAVRVEHDLSPLQLDERLEQISQDYAVTMAESDCMAHDCGGVGRIAQRATRAGVAYRLIGEALAAGPPDATRVVDLWMASEHHRDILLNPDITSAGVGHVFKPNDDGVADYGHYWVLTVGLYD